MMNFTLTNGHPGAPAWMGVSMLAGDTYFDFGAMGSLHLRLGSPLYLMPMGTTDIHGAVMMQLPVPMGMMHRMNIYGQGFTFMFHQGGHHHHHHGRLAFCTSNVHHFAVGGHH